MLPQMPEVETKDKVYLFQTSNILINTRMNLMRDLMSAEGDNIRVTSHMNLMARVEKIGAWFYLLIINKA